MKEEENVYTTTEGTEDTAEGRICVESTADTTASTVPDKFKDVNALARAYTSLQAEFTRRSQRLKELERKLDNLDASGESGAEKLRKNARIRKADARRFEDFIAETEGRNTEGAPRAEEPVFQEPSIGAEVEKNDTMYEMNTMPQVEKSVRESEEMGLETSDGGSQVMGDTAVESAQMQGQTSVAGSERVMADSETLYAQVCKDESVRLKIIGEYLSSLGQSNVPLMRGGAGTLTTPPRRANNISEAGDMALLYLKKPVWR